MSTDPKRLLIGDDEHGWADEGVFNYEGGCYAKVINLDKERDVYKRQILATPEDAAEATDSVAAEAPAVAQATSTTDSLAAALKGESKTPVSYTHLPDATGLMYTTTECILRFRRQ